MTRSWAYNRFGVLMGTSGRASGPRWPSLRGDVLPMITLFPSQGDFCVTAFHRIRYYGLHATCKAKKVKGVLTALMVALGRLIKGTYRIVAQKTYRDRVLASTGRDPLRCTRCGGEMMLWQVWHPRYGVVYDELQAIKRGRYGPCRGSPPGAG